MLGDVFYTDSHLATFLPRLDKLYDMVSTIDNALDEDATNELDSDVLEFFQSVWNRSTRGELLIAHLQILSFSPVLAKIARPR